ncbi:hypothetical protein AB0M43_39135 [Longispora sp. NPDC051575]|uniref:hypothetical protein n=1 Tax=Longispora sp. NPDC051575 TaxID=3154943 RepID=UPI003446CAA3
MADEWSGQRVHVDLSGAQGVIVGDHNVQHNVYQGSAPIARSVYLQQVRAIAPDSLRDRERELADLSSFCTDSGDGAYAWWRAGAWAGKSALMSWFALHPPAGARVVSFFITARFLGNSDRRAFLDTVIEQLADLLGRPLPAPVTPTNAVAHFADLLDAAAEECAGRGERLVLLVDGLDEDTGVVAGANTHSVAAVLPNLLPHGLRVVVASRPNPPIPADVPDAHPLRAPGILRTLTRSAHAQVVRQDSERELRRLLYGTAGERDLVGLVAAAGGGLSAEDLAELTGTPAWDLEEQLRAVSGRTFTRQTGTSQHPGATSPFYVLAHEELQSTALSYLRGVRLDAFRDRLHAWADSYRERGWPAETPEYLLRGYHRLLEITSDNDRIIACGLDEARHRRLLHLAGGNRAVDVEIGYALDLVGAADPVDLARFFLLSVRRRRRPSVAITLPTSLPAVWAAIGRPQVAEELAWSITSPWERKEALVEVIEALVETGAIDDARALADTIGVPIHRDRASERSEVQSQHFVLRSDTSARALNRPHVQVGLLAHRAAAAAASGGHEQAEALVAEAETMAGGIPEPYQRAHALIKLLGAANGAGLYGRLPAIIDGVEAVSQTISEVHLRSHMLASLAKAVAQTGDELRGAELAATIDSVGLRAQTLGELAAAAEGADAFDDAEVRIRATTPPHRAGTALAVLVRRIASAGDFTRAEALARTLDDLNRPMALRQVFMALVGAGELGRAEELLNRMEDRWKPHGETALVKAYVAAGRLSGAEDFARVSPGRRWVRSGKVACALVQAGQLDRAEALARTIPEDQADGGWTADGETALVKAYVAAGRLAAAEDFARVSPGRRWVRSGKVVCVLVEAGYLDRAEVLAQTIPEDSEFRQDAFQVLVLAMARAGSFDRAEALTLAFPSQWRGQVLTRMAWIAVRSGDLDQATTYALRAEAVAREHDDKGTVVWRESIWRERLIRCLVDAGDFGRAKLLFSALDTPDAQSLFWDLLRRHGDPEHPEVLARMLGDGDESASVLLQGSGRVSVAKVDPDAERKATVLDLVAAGDLVRADAAAHGITDPRDRRDALKAILVALGEPGDAGAGQRWMQDRDDGAGGDAYLAGLASAYLDKGLRWKAEALVERIKTPVWRLEALLDVTRSAAYRGNRFHARLLASRCKELAETGFGSQRVNVRTAIWIMTFAKDFDWAENLAESLQDPDLRVAALVELAADMAKAGDGQRASSLARRVESLVSESSEPYYLQSYLIKLSRFTDLEHSRSLLTSVLRMDPAPEDVLDVAARIEPEALSALADDAIRYATQSA